MKTLRNAHVLTRLVLVWFALFIGVAVASTLVNPEGVQWVCTTAGSVKLVQFDGDSQKADGAGSFNGLHCPLCLQQAAPPLALIKVQAHTGLLHALFPQEQARLASLTGLPCQARAPPSIS